MNGEERNTERPARRSVSAHIALITLLAVACLGDFHKGTKYRVNV
jgi:hypothetical protein